MSLETDPLQPFRQPMVTVIALILGFSIGFIGDWVTDINFKLAFIGDYILLSGILISSIVLIFPLMRILSIDYPRAEYVRYYKVTLRSILVAVSLILGSIIMSSLI